MKIEKMSDTVTTISFTDSDGWNQSIKVVNDADGKHVFIGDHFIKLEDVELWMQAMQLAKTL